MTYKTGFIGASTTEASEYVGAQVGDAKSILVPFAGSGRDIASMCRDHTVITSFDTQFYSRAVVEGVFAAKEVETNVDKPRYKKGYLYENRPYKFMDDLSAGFIDWVGANGTMLDKASIASAVVRSTLMGRMTQWYANPEQLWTRFEKARRNNAGWVNRPGQFEHHEGSVFDRLDELKGRHFDLMQVDPPKIVVGSDVYSANFDGLNTALGGAAPLPKWNWREVMPKFRQLMELDVDKIVFMYVTGVRPDNEAVQSMLESYGELEDRVEFEHRSRTDIVTVIRKG